MSDEIKKLQDKVKILETENKTLSEQLENAAHRIKEIERKSKKLTAEEQRVLDRIAARKRKDKMESKIIRVDDIMTPEELALAGKRSDNEKTKK